MTNHILITATLSTVQDSYEEGEIGFTNDTTLPDKVAYNVQSIQEIAQAYCDYLPDREPQQLDTNIYQWSHLTDKEGLEASEAEEELWKKGELDLYTATITLELFKLTPMEDF